MTKRSHLCGVWSLNLQLVWTVLLFWLLAEQQCSHAFSGNAGAKVGQERSPRALWMNQKPVSPPSSSRKNHHLHVSKTRKNVVQIYRDYASRLWNETNVDARHRIARNKAEVALKQVQNVLRDFDDASPEKIQALLDACHDLLQKDNNHDNDKTTATTTTTTSQKKYNDTNGKAFYMPEHVLEDSTTPPSHKTKTSAVPAPKKPRRSILFGATMGLVVAAWVFSGNYIFTGLFSLMTILGQLEYYRMVINTGVYPARRISVIGACSMFWTALFCPEHHPIMLPLFGLWAMIWFLTMKRTTTSIPEIATTFTGMFYLGYVPSFWVRIRILGGGREPTRLAPLVAPLLEFLGTRVKATLPSWVADKAIHLPITTGAIFIFWTWLCLAFADVAAYFVGKNMGRTKLARIAPAAGATSPNKTVEGVLGGCAVSAALGMLGAWVQKWPYWWITGSIHGTLLGLIGLIGDLTASMIKRDAGIKDFGDLIPDHGGILDRVDSFVWSAPYSWLVCHTIIPALKQAVG